MHKIAFALLWLYAFTLPWDHMLNFGNGIGEISRVLGILSTVAVACVVLASRSMRKLKLQHYLASAFLATIFASWFFSVDQDATALSIRTCLQTMMVMWVVWQITPTMDHIRALLLAYVLGAYVSSVSTIGASRTASSLMSGRRFQAEGWNANDLAVALALAIPMAAYVASTASSRVVRWTCWGYLLIGPAAIALTASRAGAVVGCIALVAALAISMSAGWKTRFAMLMAAAMTAVLLVTFVPAVSWYRIATIADTPDMNDRAPVWGQALRVFAAAPFRPLGAGASSSAISDQHFVAHNAFLGVLLDDGIAGLVCFVAILIATAAQTHRLPRLECRLWRSLLLCWTIGACTLSWEQVRITWLLFACATAAVHCLAFERVVLFPRPASQEITCAS